MLAYARRALHPGHPPAIHRAMNSEIDPGRCPLCQQSNRCTLADPASAAQACWCFTTEIDATALERIPAELRRRACLCPRCAQLLPPDADD